MQTTAQITDIIYFHGVTVPVIQHENTRYIPVRPLILMAGTDWRSAKRALQSHGNTILYGTKWLKVISISAQGGDITPQEDVLTIRFDAAHMYLARINTDKMRTHGNEVAAEQLLKQQKEWAKVLHDYETKGIATKDKNKTDTAELMNLMKLRQMASSIEKQAFTQLLHQKMAELGLPISQQQLDLLDQ